MSYSHKPTTPEIEETIETDRTAYFNHHKIGRVSRYQKGPSKGLWMWVLEFVANRTHGKCPTMADALAVIKKTHQEHGAD